MKSLTIQTLDKLADLHNEAAHRGFGTEKVYWDSMQLISRQDRLLNRCLPLLEYLQTLEDDMSCGEVCDKTHEAQGCPSGSCALSESRKQIQKMIDDIMELRYGKRDNNFERGEAHA